MCNDVSPPHPVVSPAVRPDSMSKTRFLYNLRQTLTWLGWWGGTWATWGSPSSPPHHHPSPTCQKLLFERHSFARLGGVIAMPVRKPVAMPLLILAVAVSAAASSMPGSVAPRPLPIRCPALTQAPACCPGAKLCKNFAALQQANRMAPRVDTRTRTPTVMMCGVPESGGYYEVLGVPLDASLAELKAAYHKRVKKCHPDHNPSEAAAQEFLELTEVSAGLHISPPRHPAASPTRAHPRLALPPLCGAGFRVSDWEE